MQQTETYKLNLIETSDPFSPQALNENTQKLEAVVEKIDTRVTVLEGHKAVFGSYNSKLLYDYHHELGFRPKAVIVCGIGGNPYITMVTDTEDGLKQAHVTITDTGFFIHAVYVGSPHVFIAFA